MECYTLFISYAHGFYYNGVYENMKVILDVVKEMMIEMDIPKPQKPRARDVKRSIERQDDYFHEFTDGTWIVITKQSEELVRNIIEYNIKKSK